MCINCYIDNGSPRVINETVVKLSTLISEFMEDNPGGQHAHVVFEDWNIWDDIILSCINDCGPGYEVCKSLLERFLGLSYDERATCLAIADGIIDHTGNLT